MQKKNRGFGPALLHHRDLSQCSSTLKMCAVDECADIEEMPTIQRHSIYIFLQELITSL